MEPDSSQRLVELFQRVVDTPPAERAALLERECAGDDALRARLERLVRDDETDAPLLDDFDGLRELNRSDPLVGRAIGPYHLTARVGRGGMGVVYRAERTDGLFERDVAVKLIRGDALAESTERRFELERRALARLDHEHIARLYDGGTTEDGSPYFVLEYVEGTPLDEHCDAHALDLPARLRLFVKVCRAVHFAHQNLVVHRDLKPSNVLVDARGEPKLLDFGIARILEAEEGSDDTPRQTLTRMLTLEYASPEQLTGAAVTTATDVYSLGVVLYGLLTGRRPFRLSTSSPLEWERQVSERTPTRPSSLVARPRAEESEGLPPEELARRRGASPARLRRQLAGDLDRIVLMALRKEPERRYPSAGELADDLERHLAGLPVRARDSSFAYRASRFVRRHRVAVAASAAVLVALVVGLVVALRGERRAQEQARLAREEAQHAGTEASSLLRISAFLTDTFLNSRVLLDEPQRRAVADDVLRYAERVRVEHTGDVHLQANLIDSLGVICMRLGLFDDAEALVREAMELRRAEFGARSLEYALSLGNLGELAFRRGRFDAAVEHLTEALELHRSCPVGSHTDPARAGNDLAVALRNAGRPEGAERLHREVLAMRRAQDDGSPVVAESLNNLAGILLERGALEQAREVLSEALAIRERILGPTALATGQTLANLAQAHWRLSDTDKARALLTRAEQVFRALGAQGRADLGITLTSRATLDSAAGDLDAARMALAEALDLQIAERGPDHPEVATTWVNLAILQRQAGEREEARMSLETALDIRRAAFSDTSPLVGRTLQELGTHLLGMGADEDAERHLREAVEILAAPPVTHELWLARAESMLGICLDGRGQREEALELLRSGFERLERTPDASASEREMVGRRLKSVEAAAADRDG